MRIASKKPVDTESTGREQFFDGFVGYGCDKNISKDIKIVLKVSVVFRLSRFIE